MRCILFLFLVLNLLSNLAFATLSDDISLLLKTNNQEISNQLISKIVSENPDWKDVVNLIRNQSYNQVQNGEIIEEEINCLDGKKRPYVIYIPENYKPKVKTPLIVYLHGGVGRSKIISDRIDYARKNEYMKLARKNGWFILFPFGERSAMWWDNVGQNNILNILKNVKQKYNIDDQKVCLTGFSDGASASFHLAMTTPTDFAAFIPLNGHMGVGAIDGHHHLYPANMINSPLYVINTDLDGLYPASRMRKMVDLARTAGADIFYREYNGYEHNFDYADRELPKIERFLKRNTRNSWPHHLEWKTAKEDFAKVFWLKINKIIDQDPATWHKDYNLTLVDDRVSFGFFPDYDYQGVGVKVSGVAEGDTLSNRMQLKALDIIIKCNDQQINNIDDLNTFKSSVARGDVLITTVLRGDEEIILEGSLPDPENYDLFPRDLPSAAVIGDFRSNTFNMQTSRVAAFSIYLHPDMIQLDQEVVIVVDQSEVFRKKVVPDINFLLNNYLKNRDRYLIYFKKISVRP